MIRRSNYLRQTVNNHERIISMNILLISPKYNAHIIAPHLGLGYLAASLKKSGHKVRVLDGLREQVTYDLREWDLVGVTAMSAYFPEAIAEVKKARSLGLKTIIGGPHVISVPEQSLIFTVKWSHTEAVCEEILKRNIAVVGRVRMRMVTS